MAVQDFRFPSQYSWEMCCYFEKVLPL